MMEKNLCQDFLVIENKKIEDLKVSLENLGFPSNEIFKINKLINYYGGELRMIGGISRDLILNARNSKDLDFVTDLEIEKVILCFKTKKIKFSKTGIKYGCVKIQMGKFCIEITSLRREFDYDGRRPQIEYTKSWTEDSNRRDFTINAIYIDFHGMIFDPHSGYDDLLKKKVRFIGDPNKRIIEDNLRILRFIRFSIKYGKKFEENDFLACVKNKKKIKSLSFERRYDELKKIVILKNFVFFLKRLNKNFFKEIFETNVFISNFEKLDEVENSMKIISSIRRFKFFFQKNPKKINFLKVFNNKEQKRINCKIVIKNYNSIALKKMIFQYGKTVLLDQIILDHANYKIDSYEIENLVNFIKNCKIPRFPIDGNDIKNFGFKEGSEVGKILNYLEKIWIKQNFLSTKDDLIQKVKKLPSCLRR